MPTRFISHPDPRALIGWLRDDIGRRHATEPLARLLVLTPNRRLARALRRRIVEGGRAHLGLQVLDFWALCSEVCMRGALDGVPARLAPEPVLRGVVQECLRQAGGRLGRAAALTPGVARALLATFGELREAEVSEEDVARALREAGERAGRETLRLFVRYLEKLEELERRGWVDRAGYVRRALAAAAGWAAPLEAVYLYGAYELIGAHMRLLRELAKSTTVSVLLPLDPERPAWEYGRGFARRFLLEEGQEIEYLDPEALGPGARAARLLYAEAPGTPPAGRPAVELFHAQGMETELSEVARRILDIHLRGTALGDIGVVARTLDAYAPHLCRVFEEHGVPFSTSAAQPLKRYPSAVALLALLRVLARDFERDDLLALLTSPVLRCPGAARPRPDLLERWSGEAGIRKGYAAWAEDLPAWVQERQEEILERAVEDPQERKALRLLREGALRDQVAIVEALGREAAAWRQCEGLARQADFVVELARRWLGSFETDVPADAAVDALERVLEDLRSAGEVQEGSGPEEAEAFLRLLDGAISAASLEMGDERRDGVQVLDGMQARGHTFRVLFFMGFNAGVFPRHPGEDPFLSEFWRQRLREPGGRPVPLRQNLAEEHLLLALWVSSATDRLVVSYRRADENGRAEVPSFALREIARLVHGRPVPESLQGVTRKVPVHPEKRILHWAEAPGLVAPKEAALLVALAPGNRAASVRGWLAARGGCDPGLEAALRWMEERREGWPRAEGRAGDLPGSVLPRAWSPTRLEQMARCPLQFFFERVLDVEALPDAPEEGIFDPLEWGSRVHALLYEVFQALGRESLLETDAGPLREEEAGRGRALVEGAWEEHFGDLGRRVSRRLPLLWKEHARRWREAIAAFVVRQLRGWRELGLRLVELESEGEVGLAAAPGAGEAPVLLRGKVDRVTALAEDRVRVCDYKTGRSLEDPGDGKEILRGRQLQAPIYAWIEAARGASSLPPAVDVEFLGVGPHHEEDPESAVAIVEDARLREWRSGVEETVRVLVSMAAGGRFPFHHEERACQRCAFEAACHHGVHQALRAVERDPEHADYFDTQKKILKAPTLAEVRGARRKS